MKIAIIGIGATDYLKKVIFYLTQQNRKCGLNLIYDSECLMKYELEVQDFVDNTCRIECSCIEFSLIDALDDMAKYRAEIQNADKIINLFPVKCFPALRYNVDEEWSNIDSWVLPMSYQRKLSSLVGDGKIVIWIFHGLEKMEMFNCIFKDQKLSTVLKNPERALKDKSDIKFDEVIRAFFEEIGEKEFGDAIQGDLQYFGFQCVPSVLPDLGERAMKFWCLYSFSAIYGVL